MQEQTNDNKAKRNTDATATTNSRASNSFASALLGALDEDLSAPSPPVSKRSNAPASGGFLGSLIGEGQEQQQQMRLDMQLCQLNGLHSVSTACLASSKSFDDDDDVETDDSNAKKTYSMIQLAREELVRYSNVYQVNLTNRIVNVIHEWCGSLQDKDFQEGKCIHALRHFFLSETYVLDATSGTAAEADERLEHELLVPLRESHLIDNLSKCDTEVTFLLCKVSFV